jgi:hypothetical protein
MSLKQFFFEKKNQKTFVIGVCLAGSARYRPRTKKPGCAFTQPGFPRSVVRLAGHPARGLLVSGA